MNDLRARIHSYLDVRLDETPVPVERHDTLAEEGYVRQRISYPDDDGASIPAFLLLPEGDVPCAAVIVHHQHAGARHLGKSEVCGLAGKPLQALGPRLARRGLMVLAPDSICFEERRRSGQGTAPHEADVADHYQEMAARLVRGDTLMRKVIADSARAVSLLRQHPRVDPARVGMLGHSYGGSTTLFHGALDERVRFAAASGTGVSYQERLARGAGIEMSQVIPGFAAHFDTGDLVACFAPRPLLLVSGKEDPHARDADRVVDTARTRCDAAGVPAQIEHRRDGGGHALTTARVEGIVRWLLAASA